MPRPLQWTLLVLFIAASGFVHWKVKRLDAPKPTITTRADQDQPERTLGPAPDFTLPDLSDTPVSLSDFSGETIVLNFFTTWCGPCRTEMPDLVAFDQASRASGIRVIGIDVEEDRATVTRYVREMKLSFPVLLDETSEAARLYQVEAFPTTVLVSPTGDVIAYHRGMIRDFAAFYQQATAGTAIDDNGKQRVPAGDPA